MMKCNFLLSVLISFFLISCNNNSSSSIDKTIDKSISHISNQVNKINETGKILFPRTLENGNVVYTPIQDWCIGFFPGCLWMAYELTGDNHWLTEAQRFTERLDSVQYFTTTHDLGFMIGCSYLNGLRFADKKEYKDVIVQSAKSLSTRFRPNVGVIQSWDTDKGWIATRNWSCPVIIDNMMNLELLFEATKISGDSTFYDIAVKHADTTLKNHFRPDFSSYHVIDYDINTGEVRSKETAQGFADESSWARGQAWGLYGYTVCYRYTKDPKYLVQAKNIFNYIFTNENLPDDLVPYWDYSSTDIPNTYRDVSAAACTASALYELSMYDKEHDYKGVADKIIESLSSDKYFARSDKNGNFILMHSVGSIPHGVEIDVPLNYADYYFLEALCRKKEIEK